MKLIYCFLYCGFACAISQYILEKTKFSIGHMNTLLVIIGSILSGFKVYDLLLKVCGPGIGVLIINFGYLITKGVSESYISNGLLGLFNGVFVNCSLGISFTIVCSLVMSLIFKPRN